MIQREPQTGAVRRREALLLGAAALWGLAIAVGLLPFWKRPPHPGQLASYATSIGLDARASMRFALGLIVMPFVAGLLLWRPMSWLARSDTRSWARHLAGWACVVALWSALVQLPLTWIVVPSAAAIATALLLRTRDLAFTRHDAILVFVVAAIYLSLLDAFPSVDLARLVILTAAATLLLRIAVAAIPSPLPPALAFTFVPLAILLQTSFFPRDQRYLGWPVLLIAAITPFVARATLRDRRRTLRALALVIYPLGIYAYVNATSLPTAEGGPRVSFFEDAHHLIPSSEMERGERLYRDVIPVHGIGEDAISSFVAMKLTHFDVGGALRGRVFLALFNGVAIYAMTAAATGSAEAGVLAFFLAAMLNMVPMTTIRPLAAIAAIAILAAAVRRRQPRLFAWAAAVTALAVLVSLDYGAFSAIVLAVAVLRFRSDRRAAMRFTLLGGLAVTLPFFIALGAFGIAGDFLRTTLIELPRATDTGALDIIQLPVEMARHGHVPELLTALFDPSTFLFAIWVAAIVAAVVLLLRRPTRRLEPLAMIALWTTVAAISYGERHHLVFRPALAPLLVASAFLVIRRWPRWAPAAVLALVVLARISTHLSVVMLVRHARAPIDPNFVAVQEPPRARGAFFWEADAKRIASAREYIQTRIARDETFYDFTDRGLFYFLFNRDCPVREPVLFFSQTDEAQRDVIERIRTNPRIVAALIPEEGNRGLDTIPNPVRAPLIWAYLQENFSPDYSKDGVVFWRRKGS